MNRPSAVKTETEINIFNSDLLGIISQQKLGGHNRDQMSITNHIKHSL